LVLTLKTNAKAYYHWIVLLSFCVRRYIICIAASNVAAAMAKSREPTRAGVSFSRGACNEEASDDDVRVPVAWRLQALRVASFETEESAIHTLREWRGGVGELSLTVVRVTPAYSTQSRLRNNGYVRASMHLPSDDIAPTSTSSELKIQRL